VQLRLASCAARRRLDPARPPRRASSGNQRRANRCARNWVTILCDTRADSERSTTRFRINRAIRAGGGRVFDRYHARTLTPPREVRNCVAYVLNNWRYHGEDGTRATSHWLVDQYATSIAFDGWKS
jgi:hypothetical protein